MAGARARRGRWSRRRPLAADGRRARGRHRTAAARGQERFSREWSPQETRTGFLRGTARDAAALVAAYREAGCEQLNIALRAGPYDWDALASFADDVMPAFR